jgi:hypothetical protein
MGGPQLPMKTHLSFFLGMSGKVKVSLEKSLEVSK